MTLQSSGAISLNDIRNEFSVPLPVSMSQLYRGGSYVPAFYYFKGGATPINTTVPTSGTISFSNFYNTADI